MNVDLSMQAAQKLDAKDPLKDFREKFYIPKNGKAIYFTGNSLGLQPKSVKDAITVELEDWANLGVKGHTEARNPWVSYHERFAEPLSKIVGAHPEEVVAMNGLTTNIHLLFASFYRPEGKRHKIICEAKAFPSDLYAIESQVKWHKLNPEESIVSLEPREGESWIRTEDVIAAIEREGESLALVFLGGVNYYSGQVFDMQSVTEAAHKAGAICGFDLAHAAGNIELHLHDWNVDFACWCSYKYLNAGPGAVAGAFIHSRHVKNTSLLRLAGWWGSEKSSRFQMLPTFEPIPTAEGWQLSNAPVLSMAPLWASLQIFEEAGMERLHKKSKELTRFLFSIINGMIAEGAGLKILTPVDAHGCQVSIYMLDRGKEVFNALIEKGVVADWREPGVIRVAPVPLYNTFTDVFQFGEIVRSILLPSTKSS